MQRERLSSPDEMSDREICPSSRLRKHLLMRDLGDARCQSLPKTLNNCTRSLGLATKTKGSIHSMKAALLLSGDSSLDYSVSRCHSHDSLARPLPFPFRLPFPFPSLFLWSYVQQLHPAFCDV